LASAFEIYLRTGRRVSSAEAALETKFNPWHDPEDGRFTFAGQGRFFPGRSSSSGAEGGSRSTDRQRSETRSRHDPKHPRNYSIYTVQAGDTLTRIAAQRQGLTTADLSWLNELSAGHPLRVGQKIKLPHQKYLDDGRRAREKFLALASYIELTGKLPPNAAQPPTIATQIEASGFRTTWSNGYAFDTDAILRTRRVAGELRLERESRSKSAQANAGKPDRRSTDHGGHYIAVRFKGPREWFNHFAQDASFNRSGYRTLENKWASAIQSGKRVFVEIVPHYQGTSMRPNKLVVRWVIDGKDHIQDFPNEKRRQ
jgi:LysM repeat protein